MKKPTWLQRQRGKESSDTKSEATKKIRQRTDQRMKQQEVKKAQREEAASKRRDGVHRDQCVYFGPKAPAGKENNWIQTIPGKGWNTLLRLYGPLEPWFNKT
jgi:hypothetical protein